MALLTVNGLGVIRGVLSLPRVGAWSADLVIDSEAELAGPVTVDLGGSVTLIGTVNRAAAIRGIQHARIIGGADGLRKTATPKHYTAPLLRLPLTDLLTAAGETISPTCDAAVTGEQLQAWTTLARPTGVELADLLEQAPNGTAWRILPDGTLWAGAETWPESGILDFRVISESPENARLELGLEAPVLLPGTKIDGRKADCVQVLVESGSLRATVWTRP